MVALEIHFYESNDLEPNQENEKMDISQPIGPKSKKRKAQKKSIGH